MELYFYHRVGSIPLNSYLNYIMTVRIDSLFEWGFDRIGKLKRKIETAIAESTVQRGSMLIFEGIPLGN